MQQTISQQLSNRRIIRKDEVTKFRLQKWAAMGLKPYLIKEEKGVFAGIVEITEPFPEPTLRNHMEIVPIYLMNSEEYAKVKDVSDKVLDLLDKLEQQKKLLQEYVPSFIHHNVLKRT